MVVARAEFGNLFENLLLLVNLDGVDATIAALIIELLNGASEALVELFDARVEDFGKPKQHRHVKAPVDQAAYDLAQTDPHAVAMRMYGYLAGP